MPEKNSIVELSLDRLTSAGQCVARADNMVVFVEGGAPGDRVRVEITERKERFARAKVIEVLKPSPDRIEPPCPYHQKIPSPPEGEGGGPTRILVGPEDEGTRQSTPHPSPRGLRPDMSLPQGERGFSSRFCGGCSLQHITYPRQLSEKRQIVQDALQRVGNLTGIDVLPVIGMDDPWRYRNKVQQPVIWKDGKLLSGFYAQGSHDLIAIDDCLVQPTLSVQIIRKALELVEKNGPPQRWLRHLMVRTAQRGKVAALTWVTWMPEFPGEKEIVGTLLQEFPGLQSVFQNVNPKNTNVILGPEWRKIAGADTIQENLGLVRFRISPAAFFQVNSQQAIELIESVRKQVDRQCSTLVDAYCGVGTFALGLADLFQEVAGIEEVGPAVLDATQNARLNGIGNARFYAGTVEKMLPKLIKGNVFHRDPARKTEPVPIWPDRLAVILDPPRAGCTPAVLQTLLLTRPRQILYISCDPATLARDLGILSKGGYRVESVQPIDLFPHTPHIESVVSLKPQTP